MIFVFGSNLAGIHGAGAARTALEKHGAQSLLGVGPVGESYAIPTKDCSLRPLSLYVIHLYVEQFIHYAWDKPTLEFQVTRIGCGLAGYKDPNIAPMFQDAPLNCLFDSAWAPFLSGTKGRKYWGSFA